MSRIPELPCVLSRIQKKEEEKGKKRERTQKKSGGKKGIDKATKLNKGREGVQNLSEK